ncbi:hypothetical protein EV175_004328 [Coemansia sp. RSA 1933]|nr:hypothetical protein EV175_004328 [Coemansia sp. RSA 1933]
MNRKRTADMETIVDWATEYFSSKDENELVERLIQLQQVYANDTPGAESSKDYRPGNSSSSIPLYAALYKLRKLLKMLGPLYLGLDKTEDVQGAQKPWALQLQQAASHTTRASKYLDSDSGVSDDDGNTNPPKRRKLSDLPTRNKPLEDWQVFSSTNSAALDIAEAVRMLIIVENTRRHYASELLNKKHAQGPLGDQSERWEHGFAKRNTAAETKFENLLVALKELVVLRVIADPESTERGDIKQVLGPTGTQSPEQTDEANGHPAHAISLANKFDPARCLAILNLMFPLDPLHADRRLSFNTERRQQRYAFPLQHVPSPRTQLHQLICEVEAWMSSEDCHVVPASSQTKQPQHADQQERGPMSCPAWLASARGFAWDQFSQSLRTYLHDAELKIATQYRMIHPWSSPDTPSLSRSATSLQSNDVSFSEHILNENDDLLKRVEKNAPVNATTLEHIVHHSRLADLRFTKRMLLDQLQR